MKMGSMIWDILKSCMENESKTECGEFGLEVCSLQDNSDALDLTTAVLPNTSDLIAADDKNTLSNTELSFARFLSADFTKLPFLLASRERGKSVEDSVKQSTPTLCNPVSVNKNSASVNYVSSALHEQKEHFQPEVWGSPLKINFPTDDSIDTHSLDSSVLSAMPKRKKPIRHGIPLKLARNVISAFNIHNELTSTLSSLVVLCDGGDVKKTAVTGVKMFPVPREKRIAKGLKVLTVTVDDKGSVEEWNAKLTIGLGEGKSYSCQAVYDISTGPSEAWGTIASEIKWKGASRLLEIPSTDTSTTIKACVHPGCPQSRVSTFYEELQFLHQIINSLTTNEIVWMSNGSDKASIPLMTAVKSLLESLQDMGSLKSAVPCEAEQDEEWSFLASTMNTKVAERKDLDFTDRLWKVLSTCTSTADLVMSLRLVFTALSQGQLRPFVDRHNQTTMARLVRGALSNRFFAPGLTGTEPFVLLAEMGVEKLRRDYISFFVTQGLASPSTLHPFTESEKELEPSYRDLEKLHNIVEMMTLLGFFLRLPQDTLSKMALQMLSHYAQQPFTPQEVFAFPVRTSEVRCILTSVQPVVWCMESVTEVAGYDNVHESALYCLSSKQPFFHWQDRSNGVSGKGDKSKENGAGELSAMNESNRHFYLVLRRERVIVL